MPPVSRRKPTRKAVALTEEQKELERQQEEIRQKEAALRQRLQKLPVEVKKRREEARRIQRVDTTTVAYGEIQQRRSLRGSAGPRRGLRKDRNQGRIQFLVLCLVFLLLLILLWRVMPS